MLSVLLLSASGAVISFGQRLGQLAQHRHLLRPASVVEPAAVSYREAQGGLKREVQQASS